MQTYLIVSFLCLVGVLAGLPEGFEAKNKAAHEECSKISHLDQESIKKMRPGTFDVNNPAVRDHIFCYITKVGFLNDKAELQKDVMIRKMSLQVKDTAFVEKVIEMCSLPKEGDEKLWGCRVLACVYSKSPGVVIL